MKILLQWVSQKTNCLNFRVYKKQWTDQFEPRPLAVEQEGGDEEREEREDGGGAAQQPEVVLEVHEDQEEVDHHGAEGEEDAVHAGGLSSPHWHSSNWEISSVCAPGSGHTGVR